jgi:lysophospholipase L1-like esterase
MTLDLTVTETGSLSVLTQGSPNPGSVPIRLDVAGQTILLPAEFTYLENADPLFDRVVAFGASLTQGVQDGTPTHDGVLDSPAMALSRSLGAYMPHPVLVSDLFPTLDLDSVGPAPECDAEDVADFIVASLPDVLSKLVDPEDGPTYSLGRSDPDIVVRNLAAGNFLMDDMLLGPEGDEIVQNFLGGLSLDPTGDFMASPEITMIEAVEALSPTVIVSMDLMGNDVLNRTPIAEVEPILPVVIQRLAETGAEVFLADMPDPDLLHGVINGSSTSGDDQVLADQYNALLEEEADRYTNVHVVPLASNARALAKNGMWVEDQEINLHMLGGIISFDGLHFSATGYAYTAQLFVEHINAVLGTTVPDVDIVSVVQHDFHTPDAIRAAGRDPTACWP